jgi:hypothetical protein
MIPRTILATMMTMARSSSCKDHHLQWITQKRRGIGSGVFLILADEIVFIAA